MAKSNVTVNIELSVPVNRTITLLVQAVSILLDESDAAVGGVGDELLHAAEKSDHLYLPEQKGQTP